MVDLKARGPLPGHIAVIMDGNGRWAQKRGQNRIQGHRQGVHAVRDITEACAKLGIGHLTLYTFSTQNWNRPKAEVNALMHLLIRALKKEASTFHENNIRLRSIGDLEQLPQACQRELGDVISDTAAYNRMTLTLALSYSGRWELTEAIRSLASDVERGILSSDSIDESMVSNRLQGSFLPDPDLLIRTGGEQRVSNYLLWQMAYTELHFTRVYWPDFRRNHLFEAIRDFQDRERRFGQVEAPL